MSYNLNIHFDLNLENKQKVRKRCREKVTDGFRYQKLLEIMLYINLKFMFNYKIVDAKKVKNDLRIFKCKTESNEYQNQHLV